MGRHCKSVGDALGVDRRESGHYATPDFVARFMAEQMLQRRPDARSALDPCVGRGDLVHPLLARGLQVHGFDILPFETPPGLRFAQDDFLARHAARASEPPHPLDASAGPRCLGHDIYIANPPYNCHEAPYIRDNRSWLKKEFAEVGTHNMYAMFLSAMIDCAADGAMIGVLALDSFLTARVHRGLRAKILRECSLHSLVLCPTDLFRAQGADVRTCILVLQKGRAYQGEVSVANRVATRDEFARLIQMGTLRRLPLSSLVLDNPADNLALVVEVPGEILELLGQSRLGAQFRCVTGISTGNDRLHLSPTRREGFSQPFYKNPGSRRFYCPPNAYLRDDFLDVERAQASFMVRNRALLFRPGISCSSMGVTFGATYLPEGATWGVNANIIAPDEDIWWLLAYMNSHLVSYLVRGVLNRSNMVTSGYVSRIPIPDLRPEDRRALGAIAREAHARRPNPTEALKVVQDVNRVLNARLQFGDETLNTMQRFAAQIVQLT